MPKSNILSEEMIIFLTASEILVRGSMIELL